jgi:hypothetical protein
MCSDFPKILVISEKIPLNVVNFLKKIPKSSLIMLLGNFYFFEITHLLPKKSLK